MHGVRHILIPRAHTIAVERLIDLVGTLSDDGFKLVGERLTWWLIDSSEDGALANDSNTPRSGLAGVSEMVDMIARTGEYEQRRRSSKARPRPAPAPSRHAVADAHPLTFGHQLMSTLPAVAALSSHQRFMSAADVMRSDWFDSWESGLWHCLRAARDDADALILFRGAQLATLQRRMHLTMLSDPWSAAADAPARLAAQADALLAYVDPLVASIGAMAVQTGFRAALLRRLSVQNVEHGLVPTIAGFDAGALDSRIEPYVRAQAWAVRDAEPSSSPLKLFRRYVPCTYGGPKRPATITTDRVSAVLKTLEIERSIDRRQSTWIADNGLTLVAV
jgi:hypothetical protein